ncbi:SAM-dependent DNA methyltransferase [Candidatus Poribacteria bacterium]|nr:SAM-dependent DNA methyltransferase [Candidatus Poribacteria bacterium]
MSQSGLLEITHEKLYWPRPDQVLTPTGVGPGIYVQLAQEKLGKAIERDCQDGAGVSVGILTINPEGDQTEAPLAVVCDFNKPISQATLSKTYNLAWSFNRTQALITVEPHLLRVWTCCEEPSPLDKPETRKPVAEVSRENLVSLSSSSLAQQAAASLYWVELISGQFFQKNENRFRKSHAADQMLLSNLKSVRRQLKELHLTEDIIHDLLARLIFIQFLFQRKDSSGKPALDENFLKKLHEKKTLSTVYDDLPELLRNHRDTYKFFRLLNEKFNGDLFPGKGATTAEREQEWQTEEKQVTQTHLDKLAEFVSGELEMDDGQRCLWPLYSFDAVPLDFISSIYEEFTSKQESTGVHYTPGHIVDFILDGVLPWQGQEWNLKILDPACGSGIFLVKAFQRLIHRWKNAHPGEEIKSKTLKSILEHNIFGVDINSHAVRVASFSLYLSMCDEIEPKHYWKTVNFPRLRERNLVDKDFFSEDIEGLRTIEDASKYDLVIGNAPWGKSRATPLAKQWAKTSQWEISYGNIGPLFLPKAIALTKPGGRLSMMQPSGVLYQVGKASKFREKLFSKFKVEEIVNLSALRLGLFKNSISPSCIITISNTPPDGEPLSYICPKPIRTHEDDYRIVIEPQDINPVFPQEAITETLVWPALMWGGRRDLTFVRRLSQQENLEKLKICNIVTSREGIIRGNRRKYQKFIVGKRILESAEFPDKTLLFLQSVRLPINNDPYTHSRDSTDFAAFELPQMILKQGWRQKVGRFQAAIIVPDEEGIICSQSYVSVHVPEEYKSVLEAACLSYNSKLGVYYLLLSSGRFASDRAETNVEDLLRLPIPEYEPNMLQGIETLNDVDWRIRQAFNLKESEWALIEDLFDYTLPDFKGDISSPGRQRTHRKDNKENIEPELSAYCEYFMRVIKAGFGQDKQICTAIFQEQTSPYLPVRLVAFYLNQPVYEGIKIESIDSPELLKRLDELNKSFIDQGYKEGIFYQRTARIYTSAQIQGQKVPTIYFVKPDKIRYWTRSMALRDADEVAADIMLWRDSLEKGTDTGAEP